MSRSRFLLVGLLAGAGLFAGVVLLLLGRPASDPVPRAALSAVAALTGTDTAGYSRAFEPVPLNVPEDHGPHPDFRTEWWYLTGNLESEVGRPFGFQLTFFRNALAPTSAGRSSAWDTNQLWMAHFGLTDITGGRHLAGERFARGAAGMAGGQANPFRVWLGDWYIQGGPGEAFPMTLQASQDGARVELRIEPLKPPVFQGQEGLSQKGPDPGNASYYVSWTRLSLAGEVEIEGQTHRVVGTGWLDREWSTSALSVDHVGWDWFSIQLDDGRDLMFFELRREDGTIDPLNHGALVESDGSHRALRWDDVQVDVLDWWESSVDGTRYPSGWLIRIASASVELEIMPRLRDQEINLGFRYWEGAVTARGFDSSGPLEGVGYVELTGYAEGTERLR